MIDQTAEALTYCGNQAMEQGNDALARWLYEEGLTIWRALDFQPGIAHLLERLERLALREKERPDAAAPIDAEDLLVLAAIADPSSPDTRTGCRPARPRRGRRTRRGASRYPRSGSGTHALPSLV